MKIFVPELEKALEILQDENWNGGAQPRKDAVKTVTLFIRCAIDEEPTVVLPSGVILCGTVDELISALKLQQVVF